MNLDAEGRYSSSYAFYERNIVNSSSFGVIRGIVDRLLYSTVLQKVQYLVPERQDVLQGTFIVWLRHIHLHKISHHESKS